MTTHNDSQESLLNAENVLASSNETLTGVGAVKKFVLSISVEPVLFSYVLAMSLTSTLTTSLLLERVRILIDPLVFFLDQLVCLILSTIQLNTLYYNTLSCKYYICV
jgi:hypothetical protein